MENGRMKLVSRIRNEILSVLQIYLAGGIRMKVVCHFSWVARTISKKKKKEFNVDNKGFMLWIRRLQRALYGSRESSESSESSDTAPTCCAIKMHSVDSVTSRITLLGYAQRRINQDFRREQTVLPIYWYWCIYLMLLLLTRKKFRPKELLRIRGCGNTSLGDQGMKYAGK